MIRSLVVSAAVAALASASLIACQPSEATQTGVTSGDAIPATYDWHFTPHGGTGELDFGDGDWSEGTSVFTLSCLPDTRTVRLSWGEEGEAVLTSGTATDTFQSSTPVPTDHPVLTALKSSGALDVGRGGTDMRLVGKDAGKAEIRAFFDYCDTGKHPIYSLEGAQAEDHARSVEADVAAEVAARTPPVEAAAPVAEEPNP